MENINTTISSPEDQASDLQKKQNKTALIAGLMILITTTLGISLNTIYAIIQSAENFHLAADGIYLIFKLLILNSGTITAELLLCIPNIILSVYLIRFYKKNPAHAVLKTHYIVRIAVNIFGIFACLSSIIINLSSAPDQIGINILNFSDYAVAVVLAVISCIIVFTKFKHYKVARIVAIINLASYFIFRIIYLIFLPENLTNILWYVGYALSVTLLAFKIVFWFKCIDTDTHSRIPVKQKPVPYPVAQPMYQPVYQPVYQPMYQPPVQTVVTAKDNDEEAKLLKIKHLLDSGLITQEEFEKKRAEIIEKI